MQSAATRICRTCLAQRKRLLRHFTHGYSAQQWIGSHRIGDRTVGCADTTDAVTLNRCGEMWRWRREAKGTQRYSQAVPVPRPVPVPVLGDDACSISSSHTCNRASQKSMCLSRICTRVRATYEIALSCGTRDITYNGQASASDSAECCLPRQDSDLMCFPMGLAGRPVGLSPSHRQ